MSRSHLYRAVRPKRPLASALLFAIWLGGALLAVAILIPSSDGAAEAAGAPAAALGRLLPLVAGGAMACALMVIVAELIAQSRLRAVRLTCAAVLLIAGAIVSFGANERDNVLYAADSGVDGPPTLADARAAHAPDIAWLIVGLLAAAGGLATAVAASRAPIRHP